MLLRSMRQAAKIGRRTPCSIIRHKIDTMQQGKRTANMTISIDLDKVYTYCKDLQARRSLTNAEIAERTNIPKSTIDNFFYGTTRNPRFQTLCAIIVAMEGSVDEAIGQKREEKLPSMAEPPQPVQQQPMRLSLDISNSELDRSHEQTIEAKDKHIDNLMETNARLRGTNRMLIVALMLENLAFAAVLVLDMFNPSWGYFRFQGILPEAVRNVVRGMADGIKNVIMKG